MEYCALCTQLTKWLAGLNFDSSLVWDCRTWVIRARAQSSDTTCQFCKVWLSRLQSDWHWHYLMLPKFYLRLELWCFLPTRGALPPGHTHGASIPQPWTRGRITEISIPDEYWGRHWRGSKKAWLSATTWTDNGAGSRVSLKALTPTDLESEGAPVNDGSSLPREVLSPRYDYVCGIASTWLKECQLQHGNCPGSQQFGLPSRLLMIEKASGKFEIPRMKLIASDSGTGKYCALSHCWGSSPEEGPLRTTICNLAQHMTDVPFNLLPTTFQDAVLFARGIGILCIWIDSLCIVQDDKKDWDREAKNMGRIYRHADLVILASWAKDSSGGLGFREMPPVVHGDVDCLAFDFRSRTRPFNAALQSLREFPYPSSENLNKRAWTYQERYLARRSIFFMQNGSIGLKCAQGERDDLGQRDLCLYEDDSWHRILETYTQKDLTFEQDRLPAIRGVADDIQRTRNDDYFYQYGVWKTTLYEDLIWRRNDTSCKAEFRTTLPTWSWATTSGGKTWCPDDLTRIAGLLKSTIKTLEVDGQGCLVAEGYMANSLPMLLPDSFTHFRLPPLASSTPEAAVIPNNVGAPSDLKSHTIWSGSDKEKLLGVATFDSGQTDASAQCFFLAYCERGGPKPRNLATQSCKYKSFKDVPEGSQFSREDIDSFGVYEECSYSLVGSGDAWPRTFKEEESQLNSSAWWDGAYVGRHGKTEDVDSLAVTHPWENEIQRRACRMQSVTSFVYWALLLKPVGNDKFERIGLAMLYPHAGDALNVELTQLKII